MLLQKLLKWLNYKFLLNYETVILYDSFIICFLQSFLLFDYLIPRNYVTDLFNDI